MPINNFVAIFSERADQRGRNAQRGDTVIAAQFPKTIGSRKIGGAIVKHHGGAQHQRSKNEPWAHHPPHVGEPKKRFVLVQIEPVPHVLRGFNWESAVSVYCAFW